MKKLFYLICIYLITENIYPQPNDPNQDMWITNGIVNTIAVDGGYTYLGGSFTIVGPNTGNGAKMTTTSASPNSNFPKVNGQILVVVSDGVGDGI